MLWYSEILVHQDYNLLIALFSLIAFNVSTIISSNTAKHVFRETFDSKIMLSYNFS